MSVEYTAERTLFSAPSLDAEDFFPHNPDLRFRFVVRFAQLVALGNVDECWPWRGRANPQGYGIINCTIDSNVHKNMLAHRVAYVLSGHDIPPDTLILHSCDNPPCCNPRHLRLGTHFDNRKDFRERLQAPNDAAPKRPRLGEDAAAAIRNLYAKGVCSQSELAKDYGVSQATISRIVSRN